MTWEGVKAFLACIPAIFAGTITLGICVAALDGDKLARAQKYSEVALSVAERGDLLSARIFLEKSLAFDPANIVSRFGIARLLLRLGDTEEAMKRIQTLAPLETQGYRPAHEFQARLILENPKATEDQLWEAQLHLEHAIGNESNTDPLMGDLATVYARLKEWDQAEEVLIHLSEKMLPAKLGLARFYYIRGAHQKALTVVRDLLIEGRKVLNARPDAHGIRMAMAEALIIDGRYPESEALLQEGIDHYPDAGATLRTAAAGGAYIELATRVRVNKGVLKSDDANVLIRGFEFDPRSDRLMRLGVALAETKGPAYGTLLELLATQFGSGRISEAGLHVLASEALRRNEASRARKYWEEAVKSWEDFALAHRNLALIHASAVPPDYEKAIEHVEKAMKAAPNVGTFYVMRGDFFEKTSKTIEALDDYEQASILFKGAEPEVEKRVATLLDQIGDKEGAAERRRRSSEITTSLPERKPGGAESSGTPTNPGTGN